MNFPDNCKYSDDHEWVRVDSGNIAYIGITDFAQSELGELVYVEVETIDETLGRGEIFGAVEAVKTTSDLFMPVAGIVLELNEKLEENPALINEDPYGEGWIIKIEMTNPGDLNKLMDVAKYKEHVGQ